MLKKYWFIFCGVGDGHTVVARGDLWLLVSISGIL